MTDEAFSDKVNRLLAREEWAAARRLLEKRRDQNPGDHWVLLQLGVTIYEEGRYADALPLFLAARDVVPDCPLVLWNLAGTLDALGRPADAVRLYLWLLRSNRTPADDRCWEDAGWTSRLKADCLYRLGVALRHLGEAAGATECFHKYLDLLSAGVGSYPFDAVADQLRRLGAGAGQTPAGFRKIASALTAAGVGPKAGRGGRPPRLDLAALLPA